MPQAQCFTTCDLSKPAKSTDFGADGYTASLTNWHELLQITAPDDVCGLVFVRGNFPNTPDSVLARAQRRDDTGSKGTFGIRLAPAQNDSDLELGEKTAHGLVNFRWPYSQYDLKRKDGVWDGRDGIYEEISFVRDGFVFQITRIKWGSGTSLSDYDSSDASEKKKIKLQTGGIIQFGCPCSNGGRSNPDNFTIKSVRGHGLSCTSERYEKRLKMQIVVNGKPRDINVPPRTLPNNYIRPTQIDLTATHDVDLTLGEPTTIITAYSLNANEDVNFDPSFFETLDDYLGIRTSSIHMTDRLWTGLCSTNYEASEAVEFCVIGRCVEQILCVTSMPFKPDRHDEVQSSEAYYKPAERTLIHNIIAPQYVDIQSCFFQLRLLIKVHGFIATRHLEPDFLERFRPLDDIRSAYLVKIQDCIRSVLTWLVNTDLKPGRLLLAIKSEDGTEGLEARSSERLDRCEKDRVKMNIDRSYNQACYATLAVWYAMKYCPEATDQIFMTDILLPRLRRAFESVQKRASKNKEPTPKNDVLQWFHLSCLLMICDAPFRMDEHGEPLDGFSCSGLERMEVTRTQQKFEKYVARLKTSTSDPYTSEHEELDRLLLTCGEELGFQSLDTPYSAGLAIARASHVRKKLIERTRTTRFNPGPKMWKGYQPISNGPWELLCLNHQSFLRVTDESDVRKSRDRLFAFMLSDYSFMTSWDRADSDMIAKWWDIEPTAVICATLLDLKLEGKLMSAISQTAADGISQSLHIQEIGGRNISAAAKDFSEEESVRDLLLQIKRAQEDSNKQYLQQIKQFLAQKTVGADSAIRVFDWMASKPADQYHSHWIVQSLDDTPEVYKASSIKDLPSRLDIKRYLSSRKKLELANVDEYTSTNIRSKLSPLDVSRVSTFGFRLKDFVFTIKRVSIQSHTTTLEWSGLNGRNDLTRGRKSPNVEQMSRTYTSDQLESYHTELFGTLNDSLVDLDEKHRIIFAERCTPSVVGAFMFIWHPDSLDTIDSYFGATSRFSDAREATIWTTSITISHWSIRSPYATASDIAHFDEGRINGDFPPKSIAILRGKKGKVAVSTLATMLEERSSSLVITGDPSGYSWICSIWSSLTDSEALSAPVSNLAPVLQKFIHQQASGRCMVFLILLAHLCLNLAGEYEVILSRLDAIVGPGKEVLFEGVEWGTEAVSRLKMMLWGLEALRVFEDRLTASITQIQHAQDAMDRILKQEATQQHPDLTQEYINVLEVFEKQFGVLSDVQVRTRLKIRQYTGLRDGTSTITNVEDSKTTIKQGNNIRILTYITICYLPLGFVTALFSISHATFMNQATNLLYAILVIIFVIATYGLALSLEQLIDWIEILKDQKWSGFEKGNRPAREDTDRDIFDSGNLEDKSWRETNGDFLGLRQRVRAEEV
ncbi:hypothetical protein BP6252_10164 [Coleophoma cylindrospora]|uniref:Uncharacterized protein n=1 Tax=Coleophoma cylindrospora TaxID=1849047 RepID=A0A3D8QXM6_9HELO|nr:hypothetical protein BP6252_10164 [Coleophoma cylindrospora]